jgi:hypothetical protein
MIVKTITKINKLSTILVITIIIVHTMTMIIFKKTNSIMVLERESSPDEQEQKANNKLYPKASKRVSVNK